MAIDSKEIQAQLDLQLQINKVLADRQSLLQKQQKALTDQVQLASELCKSLRCEGLDDLENAFSSMTDAAREAASEGANAGDTLSDALLGASGVAGKLGSAFDGVSTKAAAGAGLAVGAIGGLVQGVRSAISTVTNLSSAFFGIVGILGKVGGAILSAPFRIVEGLIGMSQMGGGVSPLRQELENIRKEFGNLATNEGAAAVSALNQFRKQASNLAGTGKTLRRTFGPGRQGLAKALAFNVELMKALGPAMGNFSNELKRSAVELAMYRKGLGLSAEGQAAILKHAQAMGKDPKDSMREFASMAIQMGDAFGISSKLIGKDMDEMKKDFATFGTLSTRELAQVSVFTRKLGIEVKDLQGIVGQFDNFEDAAQNASKLAQAFGLNVDAMKLMNAQNPAERLSMLQKAFAATGRSVENMSRQELNLLAQQSGLSAEAAKLAFSQRGLSMSYDQVQKAGAKAEKKQLTQAEAMEKLADNIERVFGSGGGRFKSFFDAFAQGFSRGIRRSVEFRKVLRAIRKSLRVVFWAGNAVGRMFVKMFPGVKKMLGGLADLFSPERFGKLMEGVKGAFRDLFSLLETDPRAGVMAFIDRIKSAFREFFGTSGEGADAILEGAKSFGNAILGIIQYALPIAITELTKFVNKLTDLILNPPSLDGAAAGGNDFISKMVETFGESFALASDKLMPALVRLFKVAFEKAKPYLEPLGKYIMTFLLLDVLVVGGFSAIQGLISALALKFGGAIGRFIWGFITGGGESLAAKAGARLTKSIGRLLSYLAKEVPKLFSRILPRISSRISGLFARFGGRLVGSFSGGPITLIIAAIAGMGIAVNDTFESVGPKLEKSFGKFGMQIGIMIAGLIDTITFGLIPQPIIDSIAEFFADIGGSFHKFMKQLLPPELIGFVEDTMDALFSQFRGIGQIISGIFTLDGSKIWEGIKNLFFGLVMNSIPVLVIRLVAALLRPLARGLSDVGLWLTTDGLKMFVRPFNDMWEFVTSGFISLTDDIIKIFADAWGEFQDYWGIKSPSTRMMKLGANILSGLLSPLMYLPMKLLDINRKAFGKIKEVLSYDKAMRVGKDLVSGLVGGLSGMRERFTEVVKSTWQGIKDFFGIRSPSTEGESMGGFIVDGLINGLSSLPGRVVETVTGAFGGGSFSEAMQGFSLGGITDAASSFTNLGSSIAEGVARVDEALTTLSEHFSRLQSDPSLALAVQVGRSLTGDGSLTVRHENLQVNLEVTVQLDAASLGRGILNVNTASELQAGGKTFATQGG